jgi:hypothetical protein
METNNQQPIVFPISFIEQPFAHPKKDPYGSDAAAVGVPLACVPDGYTLQSLKPYLDEYRHRPERRTGTVKLALNSFVQYVDRYKNDETSVLFVRRTWLGKYRMTVIFNYFPAGPDEDLTGFSDFRAVTVAKNYAEFETTAKEIKLVSFYGEES